jgi:hypothetical protein
LREREPNGLRNTRGHMRQSHLVSVGKPAEGHKLVQFRVLQHGASHRGKTNIEQRGKQRSVILFQMQLSFGLVGITQPSTNLGSPNWAEHTEQKTTGSCTVVLAAPAQVMSSGGARKDSEQSYTFQYPNEM